MGKWLLAPGTSLSRFDAGPLRARWKYGSRFEVAALLCT
jgi:hypothetical protein